MANGHGGKRPGAGGKKGVPRTKTKQAYEAIEMAFEGIGGVAALTSWARENQGDFYKIIFPKIIPVQVNHADNEGGKLTPSINVTIGAGSSSTP